MDISSELVGFVKSEVGLIPREWKVDKLENHLIIKGRIGWKGLAVSEYTERGPFIVGGLQIEDNRVIWKECAHVTDERYKESPEIMLEENDILMTKDGTIGKLAFVERLSSKATVAAHIHVIRSKSKDVLPKFLFYFFKSPIFKSIVESKTSGSVVPSLIQRDINSTFFPIPPLEEQEAIAKILSDFDSKIELNQKLNSTLQAVGETVFKRWFVDFEFPNQEGKPYKSSGGEMIDSELGEIPKNWEVKTLGDVLELAYGKPLREDKRKAGTVPVYGSNGQIGCNNERLVKGPGIIVGRKGNPGTVFWSEMDFFPIDTTFYVIPKRNTRSLHYLFYVLKRQGLPLLGADSAVPGLNRNIAYMNEVLIPSEQVSTQFGQIVQTLNAKIFLNERESRTLTSIRDSLLPRLMSGKIRLPVTKEKVETADNA